MNKSRQFSNLLTRMSDTPLSPVNEYYKVLNKRIMEEKTVEETKMSLAEDIFEQHFDFSICAIKTYTNKQLKADILLAIQVAIDSHKSTITRYETLPAKLAELKVRGKIDEIDEAFNLGIDKAIRVVNALPQQNTGLQDKIDRYERALREIAKLNWNDTNHHLIASNALNDR